MQQKHISSYQRINITLPLKTIRLLERATATKNRSSLINIAVHKYLTEAGKKSLRKQLEEGYKANAKESIELAEEGMALSEEAWKLSQKE